MTRRCSGGTPGWRMRWSYNARSSNCNGSQPFPPPSRTKLPRRTPYTIHQTGGTRYLGPLGLWLPDLLFWQNARSRIDCPVKHLSDTVTPRPRHFWSLPRHLRAPLGPANVYVLSLTSGSLLYSPLPLAYSAPNSFLLCQDGVRWTRRRPSKGGVESGLNGGSGEVKDFSFNHSSKHGYAPRTIK